jgi:hypothetical protein
VKTQKLLGFFESFALKFRLSRLFFAVFLRQSEFPLRDFMFEPKSSREHATAATERRCVPT